ncbi:MAG: hypothetical protein KDD37_08275 [Bdellovibrionales bacterium]|nr:hypothetical protein [Bdellovibrionales bacterium]
MKKQLIALGFGLLACVACNDESSSEAGVTPQDRCIYQGYGCQSDYNGQSFYGDYGYPISNGYYDGYAGNGIYNQITCPPDTQPVANPTFGIGCIPMDQVPNIPYSTYGIRVGGGQMSLPQSCMSNSHCITGRCIRTNYGMPGICHR